MDNTLLSVLASVILLVNKPAVPANKVLVRVTYSLTNRYSDPYVNDVFSDNILLALAYMQGKVKSGDKVTWDIVKAPGEGLFILKPGQSFAFHDAVLEKYQGKVVSTMKSHFTFDEGFRSDGWLAGDGVCHLASFMYIAAKDAGLNAEAPTRHDFAQIADVVKENGVSIYYSPLSLTDSSLQNLYITNTHNKTVAFIFRYGKDSLEIKVEEVN